MSYSHPRLVSLWHMLKQYSSQFTDIAQQLSMIESGVTPFSTPFEKTDEVSILLLGFALEDLRKLATELELDAVLAQLERMANRCEQAQKKASLLGYAKSDLVQDIKDLRSRIQDQLSRRTFYYVRPDVACFYGKDALFGTQVNDNFPRAIDDIRDAGNCLALGQGTACVMHLMRVMEVGLHALAKDIGIPYAPSWESYLSQIEKQLNTKYSSRGKKWKVNGKFYRDLSGDLMTVKLAWRNPTMHIERRYDAEDALRVFGAVKELMQRLATRLKS